MLLVLQGAMAVGKTSVMHYLEKEAPYLHLSYEDNHSVIEEIKRRQLDKRVFEDYVAIQRLWIQHEVKRWQNCQAYPYVVMDFGPEEIEFHTIAYPQIIQEDWDVESALKEDLAMLRSCLPDRILWLEVSEETLRTRKEKDQMRSRNSFDDYLQKFLPLKRNWLLDRENVDSLSIDHLSVEEVGRAVQAWCDRQIKKRTD